jgi:glucose-6-phosphate isomerase
LGISIAQNHEIYHANFNEVSLSDIQVKSASIPGEDTMTSTKESSTKASDFLEFKSVQKLKELASHPIDLSKEGVLTPQRLSKYVAESCGYHLLYGTELITDETMQALRQLAEESQALHKMERMQAGDIVNFIEGFPSEKRPALHTATRDFFEHPNSSKPATEAAKMAKKEIDKLKNFMAKIDKENHFKHLIAIAIGGSDLGPKANYLALQHLQKPGRTIHFISNIDPDETAMTLRQVDLKNTLVLIISKSGTTLETVTNEEFMKNQFIKANLKPEEHFISITGEGSPLDDKKKYLECFYIWDWVGGRFSASSMVGGVMLSFALGFDVYWDFLRGANAMDKAAMHPDISKNLPLLSALLGIWNRNFLGFSTLAIIPYCQALFRYPAHIQQVDMESNGKRIDKHGQPVHFETGPIIFGEPGTSAQHSFYQLLHQGTTRSPMELIGFKDNQCGLDISVKGTTSQQKLLSNLLAQAIALATGQRNENPNKQFLGNRPTHILLGEKLTPFALGALLAYFEHKIAFQGFIWNINSFDQEGVQLGKELATKIINRFAATNQGEAGTPYPLGDAYLKFLEEL